jgi:hypothetical protein
MILEKNKILFFLCPFEQKRNIGFCEKKIMKQSKHTFSFVSIESNESEFWHLFGQSSFYFL